MSLLIRRYNGLGRGVCSTLPVRRREVVEVSPVIVFTRTEWKSIRGTRLEEYVFAWGRNGRARALPLGLGGMFNHSDEPNVDYWLSHRRQCITFRALRDVPAGEQLTIDYGWTARDRRRWFRTADPGK
jgi:hypothetical protein